MNHEKKRRYCGEPDYPVKWCNCDPNGRDIYCDNLQAYIKMFNEEQKKLCMIHGVNPDYIDCEYCGGLGWVRCAEYDKERVM